MITCNRCGNMNHTGAVNCQTCGAPLSSKVEGGFSPRVGPQEQQEGLPAWLELLRAGERSAIPTNNNNPSKFSAADLVEDGALPSWMRPGRPDVKETAATHQSSPVRSASFPGPNTDDKKFPPHGLAANSLIDEQALPSWMRENKEPVAQTPQMDIPASSLIQPEFVPDWLKTMQPQQSSAFNPAQSNVSSPKPASPASPLGASFSARDLVDPQSLPSWMGQNAAVPVPPEFAKQPHNLSPSSLIDMESLPSWMRESGQNVQERNSGGFPPVSPAQSDQPWPGVSGQPFPASGQSWQAPGVSGQPFPASGQSWQPRSTRATIPAPMANSPVEGGGLAAASFVDVSSLPEWLRPVADQQQMGGSPPQNPAPIGNPRSSAYGIPPRVDNVQVPSRPRSELNPNGNSEVAANVFASVLGVASTAPQFPGAPAPYGQMPMQQGMLPTDNSMPDPNMGGMQRQAGPAQQPGYGR